MSDFFFGINMQKLLRLGVLDPSSNGASLFANEVPLSSEEHLFCRLWTSDMMYSQIFQKGERLVQQDQRLTQAYIIFQGQAVATCQQTQFHLGPGAVIGLAEALAGQPCRWTVKAESILHTRSIPIGPALADIQRANPGLRSICGSTVARILDLPQVPEHLQ